MLEIHVLNVGLGDSLILHTEHEGESHYSIIDCTKVGSTTPTVQFLRENNIRNISAIFITHFHNDHFSGLPSLYEYLSEVNGTLDYFVSPYLPKEERIRLKLIELLFNDEMSPNLGKILDAMEGLTNLPSSKPEVAKAQLARMNFEGNRTPSAWRDDIHPNIQIAPVSPDAKHAFAFIESGLKNAKKDGKLVNSTSHSFLLKYSLAPDFIGLFTGDLEGENWRNIVSICKGITNSEIEKNGKFIKVPHHGSSQELMEEAFTEMFNCDSSFIASISCPSGSNFHPTEQTLNFFKDKFPNCAIVCTNMSAYCQRLNGSDNELSFFDRSEEEEIFLDFIDEDSTTQIVEIEKKECAGNYSIVIDNNRTSLNTSSDNVCIL